MKKRTRYWVTPVYLIFGIAAMVVTSCSTMHPAGQRSMRYTGAERSPVPWAGDASARTVAARSSAAPVDPGEDIYRRACASCHGIDGRGAPTSHVGFDVPLPDFTSCTFATREPSADWVAITHQGGPVRGFSTFMPSFGEALSVEELEQAVGHIKSFCDESAWPQGELNLPRPLVTEKAYPEDEAVIASTINAEDTGSVMNELVYEKRFGARNQVEFKVPFGFQEDETGWRGASLGDVSVGVKRAFAHSSKSGTIFSGTAELILPTGDELTGFGKGTPIVEPFLSFGQILPADFFVHLQGGAEFPFDDAKSEKEGFFRAVLGKTVTEGPWGRAWSPMVELLGATELEAGAPIAWDIVPQIQFTLNRRQHIMMSVGYRMPVDDASRTSQIMVYLLWDWFDGGFSEGW